MSDTLQFLAKFLDSSTLEVALTLTLHNCKLGAKLPQSALSIYHSFSAYRHWTTWR